MIRFTLTVGEGDRKAPVITDPLISDLHMASIRAAQELAKSSYVKSVRTLQLPHDPAESHAVLTSAFSYQPLGIYGPQVIVDRNISLSPEGAKDTITIEQYLVMEREWGED